MNAIFALKTEKNIDAAIQDIKENLKAVGFGVLWELNFKEKIKEKGFDVDQIFYLLDACNPKLASQILNQNIEMGYVLPCKVVIYEKLGAHYIGLLKPTVLVEMIDDQFSKEAHEIEKALIEVIEKSI